MASAAFQVCTFVLLSVSHGLLQLASLHAVADSMLSEFASLGLHVAILV
jgi:hypothetical protein